MNIKQVLFVVIVFTYCSFQGTAFAEKEFDRSRIQDITRIIWPESNRILIIDEHKYDDLKLQGRERLLKYDIKKDKYFSLYNEDFSNAVKVRVSSDGDYTGIYDRETDELIIYNCGKIIRKIPKLKRLLIQQSKKVSDFFRNTNPFYFKEIGIESIEKDRMYLSLVNIYNPGVEFQMQAPGHKFLIYIIDFDYHKNKINYVPGDRKMRYSKYFAGLANFGSV